jgi:hypothetical protein
MTICAGRTPTPSARRLAMGMSALSQAVSRHDCAAVGRRRALRQAGEQARRQGVDAPGALQHDAPPGGIVVAPGYTHEAFSQAGGNPYGTADASGGRPAR